MSKFHWAAVCVGTLFAAGAVSNPGSIAFDEIAQQAGVHFITDNSATPERHQPEPMIAGVAVFDYDGDGYPDLYFVNGAAMPSLDKQGERFKNRLFHNNRNLTFTDVTDKAAVAGTGYGMAVAVGDFDNDGKPDLFIANLNGNQLFRNNGDGTFTDVTAKAGVAGGTLRGRKMWSAGAAWIDYNNDGLLDLFVANYCAWDPATEQPCVVRGIRFSCSPKYYKPLSNQLYRNNGDGTFTDVSEEVGLTRHFGKGMGVGVADYDGDGYPDIFVANDTMPNQLFHNIKGKRFEEVALSTGVAFAEDGNPISGMGVAFTDVFNHGHPDVWVTAIEQQTFPLFRGMPGGVFEDVTSATGLGLPTAGMSGWSNAAVDFDNDGWKDLFVARSNVSDNVAMFSPRTYDEPNSVFRNLGNGKFKEVSSTAGAAFQLAGAHRGAAYGDLDNDGKVDLVVTVLNGPAKIFHNVSPGGNHWIMLQLQGTRSNRMGLGAKIKLTAEDGSTQYDQLSTSSGYASSSDPRVHFGLGVNRKVKSVEILWPSGFHQIVRDIPADHITKIVETSSGG